MQGEIKYITTQNIYDKIYKDINIQKISMPENVCVFNSPYNTGREFSYLEYFLYTILKDIEKKRVLSIGGGIDSVALFLAAKKNQVVSTDISSEAVKKTMELAKTFGLEKNIAVKICNFEKDELDQEFDIVIAHDALHHMDIEMVLPKVHKILAKGGYLLGVEPVCLMKTLHQIHRKLPFHPVPFCEGIEDELSKEQLTLISRLFSHTSFNYFDCFTRKFIVYYLYKAGFRKALRSLGHLDFILTNHIPLLKYLSQYTVFKAVK
jgi:hypothetical protein